MTKDKSNVYRLARLLPRFVAKSMIEMMEGVN